MTPVATPAAPPAPPPAEGAPMLVYDGDCAFCSRSVQFILRHDRVKSARFAARDGVAGRAVRERHPHLLKVDSLIWVETREGRETPLVRSDSVLAIARYLGGGFASMAAVGGVVPRPLRDLAYDLVARVRRRLAFGGEACVLFTDEERARSLS